MKDTKYAKPSHCVARLHTYAMQPYKHQLRQLLQQFRKLKMAEVNNAKHTIPRYPIDNAGKYSEQIVERIRSYISKQLVSQCLMVS
jgi:hypothetical protein